MRKIFVIAGVMLAWAVSAPAQEKQWCFSPGGGDGGKLHLFPAQVLTMGFFLAHEPGEELSPPTDSYGKAVRIAWSRLDNGTRVTAQLVATYHGHDVYCFIYKPKVQGAGEPPGSFDHAVLAYADGTGKGAKLLRTFFIVDGELVSDFEVKAELPKGLPPCIDIVRGYAGTGVFTESETIELSDAGPRLAESTYSGRKPPAVTYHYDKNGRVTATEKDFSD